MDDVIIRMIVVFVVDILVWSCPYLPAFSFATHQLTILFRPILFGGNHICKNKVKNSYKYRRFDQLVFGFGCSYMG